MKKNVPQTSHDAHKAFTKELKAEHHAKIISALFQLKEANYEEIAKKARMERHAVGRRISELVSKQLVFNTGNISPTTKGRGAMVYALTAEGVRKLSEPPQKPTMTDKEAEETWNQIQNEPLPEKKPAFVQSHLF